MQNLNMATVRENIDAAILYDRSHVEAAFNNLRVAVFVMCGGGNVGKFAAEQPADFYIDDRVKVSYPAREIMQAVAVLVRYAEALGYDPHGSDFPPWPWFHACGVF